MSGRILVVEDDVALATLYQHVLTAHGFDVRRAATGKAGLECVDEELFDAIVSDIAMPELDGVGLLERLREIDALVPVIFLTGQAEVETVQRAIELRAFRYLIKPVDLHALVAVVRRAASCCRWARARQEAALIVRAGLPRQTGEQHLAEHFEQGLGLLRVYYQPMVDASRQNLHGFRIIGRSLHPMFPTFDDLRHAADRLGRRQELRHKLWSLTAAPLEFLDESSLLFVWTDFAGLADITEHAALAKQARQTVLMVSDREGIEHGHEGRKLLAELRAAGYRLGVDQLGDGYAGLSSLAWLEPEFLELESALVRRVGRSTEQRRLAFALGDLAKELGATLIAEGVADEATATVLAEVGCTLFSWDTVTTPDELAPFSAASAAVLRP